MKRVIGLVAVMLFAGCEHKQREIDVRIKNVDVTMNPQTVAAIVFCHNVGKAFRGFEIHNWERIHEGTVFYITCEQKG